MLLIPAVQPIVTASLQTTFYIIAGTINFLYVLMYIVNDRSKGIRGYLKLLGLKVQPIILFKKMFLSITDIVHE